MIRYYQKSIDGQGSYCESEAEKASHFCLNGGSMELIANLPDNLPEDNELTDNTETEPLAIPTMNFNEEDDKPKKKVNKNDDDNILPLPSMNFDN